MQNRAASMPIDIAPERPRSALLRGVRITEFKGHIINPDPIILAETDLLLEEFLSPTKLKALTGVNDLRYVEHLEMIVDTSETSLGNFGIYLPFLKQLKLNGSHVPRIRDLGTSLVHLKVLWLSRSGLTDLDGIPTLNNLQEIYLAYNEITDLSPCSLLENLKCLDLEGNLIDDIKQIEFLNLCSNLENLTLYGNPICVKPSPEAEDNDASYSYRHEVIKSLPSLRMLDDELTLSTSSLSPGKKSLTPNSNNNDHQCPFDDDWQIINQCIDEGIGPPEEKLAINESLRPGTSSSYSRGGVQRPVTSIRPLSSMRPLSSFRLKTALNTANRPNSRLNTSNSSGGGQRSGGSSRLNSAVLTRPSSDSAYDALNEASQLTTGSSIQGNPLRGLLGRKKNRSSTTNSNSDSNNASQIDLRSTLDNKTATFKPKLLDNSETKIEATKLENNELRDEIQKWKRDHAQKLQDRKEYFEPQVLKIDDTYEEPLSDHDDEYDEYHNVKSLEVIEDNVSTISLTSRLDDIDYSNLTVRPKTAFTTKQSYEFDESIQIENTATSPQQLSQSELRSIKKEKKREKRSKSRSGRRNSTSRPAFPLPDVKNSRDRSSSNSRLATSDTGYESISNLRDLEHTYFDQHQPKIASTNNKLPGGVSGANNYIHNGNSFSLATRPVSVTLNKLKTPLAPLTAIKLNPK